MHQPYTLSCTFLSKRASISCKNSFFFSNFESEPVSLQHVELPLKLCSDTDFLFFFDKKGNKFVYRSSEFTHCIISILS
uniref:Putative ovule protein n=1 Tax=Solanum chacoense TaxID=4108 RepID=A0A0V0GNM4_SOLCH